LAAIVPNVVIPNAGVVDELDAWRTNLNSGQVRLFDSFHSPAHTDTPGDYNESSFAGYAALSPAFAAAYLNAFGQAQTDAAVLTWTYTAGSGSALVYGWILVDASGTKLLAVCLFPVPVTLTPGSPDISRSISITDQSQL